MNSCIIPLSLIVVTHTGSDVSVAPPMAYFRNLASALKATTTIPPSVLNNLSRQDLPARLSMCIERRPHRSLSGMVAIHIFFNTGMLTCTSFVACFTRIVYF